MDRCSFDWLRQVGDIRSCWSLSLLVQHKIDQTSVTHMQIPKVYGLWFIAHTWFPWNFKICIRYKSGPYLMQSVLVVYKLSAATTDNFGMGEGNQKQFFSSGSSLSLKKCFLKRPSNFLDFFSWRGGFDFFSPDKGLWHVFSSKRAFGNFYSEFC